MADKKPTKTKARNVIETPETPESHAQRAEVAAKVSRPTDRVASVSWRSDGSADQQDGYEVIGSD